MLQHRSNAPNYLRKRNHIGGCAWESYPANYNLCGFARRSNDSGAHFEQGCCSPGSLKTSLEAARNASQEGRGIDVMMNPMDELHPPTRLMLTPGPSCMSPRVYRALASPVVGHIDPWFTEFMGGVQELMRRVFQTRNNITFPISASGSAGIETAVLNVLEPGDEAIVCVNGTFSGRMAEIADRTGAKVHRVSVPFGRAVDPQDVRRAGQGRKIKFVGLAHGETSTGVLTRLEPMRKVADELGALLV